MSFEVSADAYARLMARFSEPMAVQFADLAGVGSGGESGDGPADGSRGAQRVLDVGCGPGALSAELVRRLGSICAVDPSEPFVLAARDRLPEADVRLASAEQLPFEDDRFDVTLAQLVVQFMTDPVAGLREMARVTRPGGVVAACVWDRGGGRSPLSTVLAVPSTSLIDGRRRELWSRGPPGRPGPAVHPGRPGRRPRH